MTADDDTIALALLRIIDDWTDEVATIDDGATVTELTTDADRDDYFYLHLDNGQVFRVEVTEVHNRRGN